MKPFTLALNSHSHFCIYVSHTYFATVGVTWLSSGATLSEFKALGCHILAVWVPARHISHLVFFCAFLQDGGSQRMNLQSGESQAPWHWQLGLDLSETEDVLCISECCVQHPLNGHYHVSNNNSLTKNAPCSFYQLLIGLAIFFPLQGKVNFSATTKF